MTDELKPETRWSMRITEKFAYSFPADRRYIAASLGVSEGEGVRMAVEAYASLLRQAAANKPEPATEQA